MSTYLVPDVLPPGLALVFCGTALGHESARQKAYYAHPGNQFWRALHRTGLTPRLLKPQEYATLPQFGIGLTDLCKLHSGNDHELPENAFDAAALKEKLRTCRPRLLAFTSKNAASGFLARPVSRITYGLQSETFEGTQLFVLPSPSGQARRWWREEVWQALASLAPPLRGSRRDTNGVEPWG